ncbi:hypothetical protein LSTR_LSTR015349 [Laodelphax striatellus]|uniref:Uncharacterized protein n=1 Tax=Laodelphax striatellus TaxID=195883 RepID=A0A482X5J5_LAOST|nr:hypothetical protein LSTR_LSTR015349 [Laodelphax striatellus]
MENISLENISEFLTIDNERIQSFLSEKEGSPKNVLQVLSELTNYFREIVNRHKYIGQVIESKKKVIALREKDQSETVQKLLSQQADIEESNKQLQEKMDIIKNTQYDLFARASDVSELVYNLEDEDKVNMHKKLCQSLNVMQNKVDLLQKNLDMLKVKQNTTESLMNAKQIKSKSNTLVLNDKQLDAIYSNFGMFGENITVLMDDVNSLEKELRDL